MRAYSGQLVRHGVHVARAEVVAEGETGSRRRQRPLRDALGNQLTACLDAADAAAEAAGPGQARAEAAAQVPRERGRASTPKGISHLAPLTWRLRLRELGPSTFNGASSLVPHRQLARPALPAAQISPTLCPGQSFLPARDARRARVPVGCRLRQIVPVCRRTIATCSSTSPHRQPLLVPVPTVCAEPST